MIYVTAFYLALSTVIFFVIGGVSVYYDCEMLATIATFVAVLGLFSFTEVAGGILNIKRHYRRRKTDRISTIEPQ